MRINYNVSSIIARNALNNNDKRVAASTQKLSSGYKINSASDNAAGLAIARRMNAQLRSLQQANQNANDGLSVVNTADGAMTEMHDILQRMNELAIQSANGTNSDSDREMIQTEIDQLVNEIDRIASTTQFNAQTLLDGSFAYKGYTNTENMKVMSYSEGVATGTYVLGQLTYCHYEDKVTTYVGEWNEKNGGKITSDITHDERFSVEDVDRDVKAGMVTSTSIDAYKSNIKQVQSFPDGAKVIAQDENIIIKAENDFELKVTLNSKTPGTLSGNPTTVTVPSGAVKCETASYINEAGSTTATTKTYSSVTKYKNIAVQSDDGTWYSIKELNFYNETDSKGDKIDGGEEKIYTRFEDDDGRDLQNDLKGLFELKYPDSNVTVKGINYHDKPIDKGDPMPVPPLTTETATTTIPVGFFVTIEVFDKTRDRNEAADGDDPYEKDSDGKYTYNPHMEVVQLDLYQKQNEFGVVENPKTLGHYISSRTDTIKTEYKIGDKDDPANSLTIDVTKMGAMLIQVGANSGQYLEIEIPAIDSVHLGIDGLDVSTEDSATASINVIGDAINQLSAVRSKIGAYANRLEHTITNLDTVEENITASYSRIMDVDMAEEMTEYTTTQVLVQASTSMLAQANERPQQVLQLLQ